MCPRAWSGKNTLGQIRLRREFPPCKVGRCRIEQLAYQTDKQWTVSLTNWQKQPPGVFCEKFCPKYLTIFWGKRLCWSLFFIKLQTFRPVTLKKRESNTGVLLRNFCETPFLQNICTWLLLNWLCEMIVWNFVSGHSLSNTNSLILQKKPVTFKAEL